MIGWFVVGAAVGMGMFAALCLCKGSAARERAWEESTAREDAKRFPLDEVEELEWMYAHSEDNR